MSGPIQIGNIPGVPGLTADVTGETGGIMFSFFNDSPDGTILVNFTVTGPNFPHNQAHTVFD
jgi:hypothetical protein